MYNLKKITAIILSLIITFSLCAFSASAEDYTKSAPVLSMKVKSDTSTIAVVDVNLVAGEFSALELKINYSSKIKSCSKIVRTSDFSSYKSEIESSGTGYVVIDMFNPITAMVSIVSTKNINKAMSMYEITFTKDTSSKLSAADLSISVSCCQASYNGKDVDLDSNVSWYSSLDTITLSDKSKSMNYKTSTKLTAETTIKSECITWSSSNPKVAIVDDNGNVTAVGKGTAVITVGTPDGLVQDECTVRVSFTVIQWIIYYLLLGFLWY